MKGYFEKMKKFVLAFGIPVLAVASLIGSGYATWYFNNAVNDVTGTIGVKIEPKKVVGAKFKHPVENIKLVLDQPDKDDGMPDGRLGVHFDRTFSEFLVAADGATLVSETAYDVTTTVKIPSNVAGYVNFTLGDQTSSTDKLTLTKSTRVNVVDETQEYKFFETSDVVPPVTSSNVISLTVKYAKEPLTSDEYDAMVRALSGEPVISISFAATIVTTTVSK